jgi:hypothetical protein
MKSLSKMNLPLRGRMDKGPPSKINWSRCAGTFHAGRMSQASFFKDIEAEKRKTYDN